MMHSRKTLMAMSLAAAVAMPTTNGAAEPSSQAKTLAAKSVATAAPMGSSPPTKAVFGANSATTAASVGPSPTALPPAPASANVAFHDSPPARDDAPSAQGAEVLAWGREFASDVSAVLEKWIASGVVSEDKLFSALYYPMADTDPMKFRTDYDTFGDRDLLPIQERILAKSALVVYAVTSDRNGYVPTHNRQFSLPLSGNRAVDLLSNRSKRMFGDVTGFRAARNEGPHLFQQYKRDTGEVMADLSVPLRVRGRHWGCVRIGYRPVDKP